ncbi:MAG: sporulation protein YunB [Oscillospiraceae bacterium]|nr:sporulation protein YunB [Oscillospiraceae bacterium]
MRFLRRLRLRLRCRPLRPRTKVLLLALLLIFVLYLRFGWLPTVRALVIMEVDNETSNLINEAIDAYLAGGGLRYEDLVTLERSAGGGVAAARIDLAAVNRMKSVILRELGERVPARVRESVRVPLGNVILPALFSGHGGSLPVRVISLRSANAELESGFSQAGVNQTLHTLSLQVEVELLLLTPGGIFSRQVTAAVPVAQTIIVGDVPSVLLSTP